MAFQALAQTWIAPEMLGLFPRKPEPEVSIKPRVSVQLIKEEMGLIEMSKSFEELVGKAEMSQETERAVDTINTNRSLQSAALRQSVIKTQKNYLEVHIERKRRPDSHNHSNSDSCSESKIIIE